MTTQFAIALPVVNRDQFCNQHSGKFTQRAAGHPHSDETGRNKFLILRHRPIGRPRARVARAVGGKVDGSPVRGPKKDPIIRLNESTDLQTFQAELIRLVKTDVKHAEILFSYVETRSRSLSLPMWIQSHLERHAGLRHRLDYGDMVGFSNVEDGHVRQQASGGPSSVILVPILSDGTLHAVIGLVSAVEDPQPSAEDIEGVRELAHVAAPILVRLCTIEKLRSAVEERNALQVFAQMRSHLEANIAHDLRTPLAAIRGYVRMMLEGRGGEVNDTQRQYLQIAADNTNRLIAVLTQMSYFNELGPQYLALSTFDLRQVWTACFEKNRSTLEQKSLRVTEHIPHEEFGVIADREKLNYVLNELLAAAVEFSETGGTIVVEFSRGRENETTVKISNKSASIPTDVLGRIFERSINAAAVPTAQSTDGGAISLYRVYDIVGIHGGRVFVNSSTAQGATFLFTLPAVSLGGEETSDEQAVNSGSRRR